MNISPARTAAFDILLRIEKEKAFTSVLLPMFEASLEQNDRRLCHELTLGTLRKQMLLDRFIDALTGGKKIDLEIRIALRMGVYQLYYLDKIPPYSAINESVNLVQRAKKTSAKGFVNAVLRRASREKPELKFADEIEKTSVETSHPRWLIEKWTEAIGFSDASDLARANNDIAQLSFRFIGEISEEGRRILERSHPSEHVDGCYILLSHDEKFFELAASGEIYIQDEASQMAAHAVRADDSQRILDVCASPGGKTGLIAGNLEGDSKVVVAGDLHWTRVEYLKDNCRNQGAGFVHTVQYDAEKSLPFADETFDSILVDAPCSGTGTIRHNPELRYFIDAADLTELAAKQLTILNNASKLVRSGGELIYSTCSLEEVENESVAKSFLDANSSFQLVRPNVAERYMTDRGYARTWPQRDKMDGFFIAAFRKR